MKIKSEHFHIPLLKIGFWIWGASSVEALEGIQKNMAKSKNLILN
jgi:hypothetical protein